MQAEHALVADRQHARGKRTCSQVDKITEMAHEGVQVALRMLGDVPVVEAGYMLLYLLLYHTLQRCIAQACTIHVHRQIPEELQELHAHEAGPNPA